MSRMQAWLQRNGIGKGFIFFALFILMIITGLTVNIVYSGIQNNYTLNDEEVTIHLPYSVRIQSEVTAYNAADDLELQGIMDADTFRYKVEKATGRDIHSIEIKSDYYTIPANTHYEDLMVILGLKLKD